MTEKLIDPPLSSLRQGQPSDELIIDVLKFGGTSVRRLAQTSKIIRRHINKGENPLIVVSARGGVTRQLKTVVESVGRESDSHNKKSQQFLEKIHKQHLSAAYRSGLLEARIVIFDGLQPQEVPLQQELERLHEEARDLVVGKTSLSLPEKAVILTGGERRSNRLAVARLDKDGVSAAVAVDAESFLITDDNYMEANVIWDASIAKGKEILYPLMDVGATPVVTGFTGGTQDGKITCLGDGSSDYAATALAKTMNAGKVVIFTDVGGIYTDDPKKDPNAISIPEMSIEQADMMAKAGHKVLHKRTLEPLFGTKTVVYVRDTSYPSHPGTRILC